LGYDAGYGTSGVNFTQCTFIGDNSYPTHACTNVTMLGYGIADGQVAYASPTAYQNQIAIGNTAVTRIGGQVVWSTYSDARFKTNIKDDIAGLDFILKLKPVTYNERPTELHKIWGTPDSLINKIDHSDIEKMRFIGFVAQDVEKAAKECGFDFPGIDIPKNDKEVYALRYSDFIMPMVKGMQEQQKQIENYELRIKNLELSIGLLTEENENLKSDYDSRLKKLEEILGTKKDK
jgi:hypothetical protein